MAAFVAMEVVKKKNEEGFWKAGDSLFPAVYLVMIYPAIHLGFVLFLYGYL